MNTVSAYGPDGGIMMTIEQVRQAWRGFRCWLGLHKWGRWHSTRVRYAFFNPRGVWTETQERTCEWCGLEDIK